MTRALLRLAVAGAFVIAGLSVFASEPPIRVRLPEEDAGAVHAGAIVRRVVIAENPGVDPVHVGVEVPSVDGIRFIGSSAARDVAPGSWDVFALLFQVAAAAPPGRLNVGYTVYFDRPEQGVVTAAEGTLSFVVLPNPQVKVAVSTAPSFVRSDVPFDLQLRLSNTGNVPLALGLEARSSARSRRSGTEAPLEPIALEAGEVREVSLSFIAPLGLTRVTHDRIEVRAADSEWGVNAVASTRIELVPETLTSRDAVLDYPVRVSTAVATRNVDDQRIATSSLGLSGSSFVGMGRDHLVEFDVRQNLGLYPLQFGSSNLDRYSFRYLGPVAQVDVGDRTRSVSPLVQRQEQTRGAGVEVTGARVRGAALFQQASAAERDRQLLTAAVGLSSAEGWGDNPRYQAVVSVTAAADDGRESAGTDLVISVQQSLATGVGVQLDGEVAAAPSSGRLPGGSALRFEALSGGPRLSLSASGHLAGPQFPTHVGDSYAAVIGLGWRTGLTGLKMNVGTSLYQSSLSDPGPADDRAYRRENATTLAYQLSRLRLGLGVIDRVEGDVILGDVMSVVRRFRAEASISGGSVSADAAATLTRRSNRDEPEPRYGTDTRINLGIARNAASFGATAQYRTQPESLPRQARSLDLGLRGSMRAGSIQLGSDVDWSIRLDDPSSSRLTVAAEAAARLGASGLLSGTFRAGAQAAGDVPFWRSIELGVAYSAGVNVPYARRPDIGSVHGVLTDVTGDQRVSGALVRLGDQATITDSEGHYVFPAVLFGDYLLTADASAVRPGLTIREESTRVRVDSRAAVTANLELVPLREISGIVIAVTPTAAAAVAGVRIEDWREALDAGDARSAPLAAATVIITSGDVVFTAITNSQGRFRFAGLEPGTWRLSVRLPGGSPGTNVRLAVDAEGAALPLVESAGLPGSYEIAVPDLNDVIVTVAGISTRRVPRLLDSAPVTVP